MNPLEGKTILDVGCGEGQQLLDLVSWGAQPADLAGIDLLEARVARATARARQPAATEKSSGPDLRVGTRPICRGRTTIFDIAHQNTVFTSILDAGIKRDVAGEIVRVLKPGGVLIWYDFLFNNPQNPNVKGIGAREVRSLFPSCHVRFRRVTLAPPIARRLVPISWVGVVAPGKIDDLQHPLLGDYSKAPVGRILMRILHVTPHYYPALGGAETYTKEISERLAQRGHDVTVLTINNRERLPEAERINGVDVVRFRPPGRLHDLFTHVLRIPGALQLLRFAVGMDKVQMCATSPYGLHAFRLSVRSKPDVVTVLNWYGGWLPYQACLARKIRTFALVGVPFFHTECSWSHAEVFGEIVDGCDAVMAVTEHEEDFIGQRSSRDNAHVVGVGVDPSQFTNADGRQLRTRHGIGDAPLVGYVGFMSASKGVATVIQAMRKVWQTEPTVRLLLAGGGFPAGSTPHDKISQAFADLSDVERSRIIMLGRFDESDKASIFDALDVFAMPSVAESFGIAYLEAWMRRKAVIGARIPSSECVIEHGVDGLLVAPWDADDLAGSILSLLSDRALREKMGRLGYAKTMTSFTWDKVTDKIEHIYTKAYANAKQTSAGSAEKPMGSRKSRSTCA